MNTPAKILIGIGTISGISGAGYAIHQQLSTKEEKEDIRKKLIDSGYEILEKTNGEWTNILEHYKTRITEGKKDLQFDDFLGNEENALELLKTKCEKMLNNTNLNRNNFGKTIKWCTVPKTLEEILRNGNYTILDTDTRQDQNAEEWNKKMADHEAHTKEEEKIIDLALDKSKVESKDKTERDKLKETCKGFKSKKHYEKDFETTLGKSTLWCTNR